jgi:uncharacterized protein (TIRG00374 family)
MAHLIRRKLGKMHSKTLIKSLRFIITIALLGYVFWKSGLFSQDGRQQFVDTLGGADLSLLLLSFCFPPLLDLISSVKWHYLSLAIKLESRIAPLFAFYLMGRFFNLVLPSNIGGDIVRVHLHGKMTGQRALSAAAVFMERYTGLVMLILIALLIGWLQSRVIDIPFLGTAMLVTIMVTVVAAWAIVDDRLFGFFHRLTVKLVPKLDIVFVKVNKFRSSVLLYRHAPAGVAWSMVLAGLFYAVAIVYVWVAVSAFDPAVSLYSMFIAVPLIMVMMNLPISIGGIGLMEFAYTVILGTVGVAPETALATALLMRLHTLVSAAIGGLLYAVRHDKAAEELLQAPQETIKNDSVS